MKLCEGTTIEKGLSTAGQSTCLLLDKELLEYLSLTENDTVVIKLEHGRWGNYIGVGKKGKH